jgi:hypothetical protein
VLSVAAARAPAEGDITMFNEHAVGRSPSNVRSTSFFAHSGLSEEDVARTPMAHESRLHELGRKTAPSAA